MNISRRKMLAGGFGAAAYMSLRGAKAAGLMKKGRNLRIGIMSDIHITDEKSAERVEKAFSYLKDQKVDGVLISGDLIDGGVREQLEIVAKTWFKVFPGNRGKDGEIVEKLFVYGNHDIGGHKYSYPPIKTKTKEWIEENALSVGDNRKKVWEELFKENWEPIWKKTVKGYTFVGGSWSRGPKHVDGAPKWLRDHAAELKGEKPFFYIQHPHPKGTIPHAWSGDDGTITEALAEFPNAVAVTGHSHMALVDDRSIWQGAFTCINASSLRYTSNFGGRENSREFGVEDPKTSQMFAIWAPDVAPVMVMDVYDDAFVFHRQDILSSLPIGEDWVFPWKAGTGHEMSYSERAQKQPRPQFGSTARIKVSERQGLNRRKEKVEQVVVEFPNVRKMSGSPLRAYDYEVVCEIRDVDVVKPHVTKRVFSPKYYLPETKDSATVTCVFAKSELPQAKKINDGPFRKTIAWRFAVRPCSCFGVKGEPLATSWFEA
ncbi:MAG: metallophosphoesterase [Kiritimatiellae bacterium]|nr:metallophosphoesterase [Kiritimatiellia bacterium]